VRGPLNVARSPQDRPVLIMSGPAEADIDLASGAADVVLIEGQPSEALKVAVGDLKRRAAAIGRKPETVKVLATIALTSEPDADSLQALLESSGCDGFNFVLPADVPGLQSFIDRVLPELRRHGIAGQGQQGATLRAHLGLGTGGAE